MTLNKPLTHMAFRFANTTGADCLHLNSCLAEPVALQHRLGVSFEQDIEPAVTFGYGPPLQPYEAGAHCE